MRTLCVVSPNSKINPINCRVSLINPLNRKVSLCSRKMSVKVRIGHRLRARAAELRLSDAEVARRVFPGRAVGSAERRYSNYVTNQREPDFETLLKICNVLQTTPNYLLGVAQDNSPAPTAVGGGRNKAGDHLVQLKDIEDRSLQAIRLLADLLIMLPTVMADLEQQIAATRTEAPNKREKSK